MENSINVALSQQIGLQRELGVIANNIANSSTPGFKGERVVFNEFLVKTMGRENQSYVQDIAVVRDTRQGTFKRTGNTFDMALDGQGFFVVDSPTGERFTRNGVFQLDTQGRLATNEGNFVLGEDNNPIVVPPDQRQVQVQDDGTITAGNRVIGKLRVVRFENELALRKSGSDSFVTDRTPIAAERIKVVQGSVEDSNVRPILEMTRMIELLRSYENNQKIIEGENERIRSTVRKLSTSGA